MAKATRVTDTTTPKKRTRKSVVHSEATNGNGTEVVEVAPASPAIAQETQSMPVLEEKIRVRAYELYLQRRGQHGSPEQDWLQAAQEICGQRSA
jgi:hypothetical protein